MQAFLVRVAALLITLAATILPVRPDTATAVEKLFSTDTVAARTAALDELAAAKGDATATYALGAARFFIALEKLGQGLHRHGLQSPRSMMVPLMRLPVPDNPSPEPLTYEKFRAILTEFHAGMAEASKTLADVPAEADIGVLVDLTKLGIDMNTDSAIDPTETAAGIMAALQSGGRQPIEPNPPQLAFRFDRADGYWLQGYANFLMAQADFWLAHEFRPTVDGSFHLFFPNAGLPMQDLIVQPGMGADIFSSEAWFADFISFVHLINWPVVEPDRRRAARTELLETIRLSRENWKAIRAETDNDREWLPGPQQKGISPLTGLEVGEEQVEAWHQALQLTEDLLEGRTLLPHFRFKSKGVDMKRFFDDPKPFDLVMSLTGPGVVPYLADGPLAPSNTFWNLQRGFAHGGFLAFAIWFN